MTRAPLILGSPNRRPPAAAAAAFCAAFAVLCLGVAPSLRAAALPGELLWEGFESGATQWTTAGSAVPLSAGVSRDVASEGSHAFGGRVVVGDGDAAKAAQAGFYVEPDADFSRIDSFRFDLYNGTDADWTVTVVFQTGPAWDWNETAPMTLKPGWNRDLGVTGLQDLVFPGTAKKLSHPDDVAKIAILCKPARATQGALYLDNVRVSGAGAAALVPRALPGTLKTYGVDSFENPTCDLAASSGAALRTEPDLDHHSEGKQGLRLVAVATDPEQNAVFAYQKDVDLSGVQAVVVDAYNPGPPAMLALNESFGADWAYAEGPGVSLRTGWNYNVTFNLLARDFKSAATDWKANGALPSLQARKLGFTWSPGDTGKLSLTLDNLRFAAVNRDAARALAPPPPEHGFETSALGGSAPSARSDYSSALGATFCPAYVLAGDGPSLRLQWNSKGSSDAADYQWASVPDLRGIQSVRLDIYNAAAFPVDFGVVFKVGPSLSWTQSKEVHLAPGWNEGVEIPLDGAVFKSAASNWNYGYTLAGRSPSDLGEADWHVEPSAPGSGSLYIARASYLRSGLVPGSDLPAAVRDDVSAGAVMDAFNWSLWDSGAGEGTFEKGLSGWQGLNGGGFDASVISVGTAEASQGKQAMRVDMRGSGNSTGNDKCGVVYEGGAGAPAFPDLSRVHRIRLDVFNPGRPLALELAFSVAQPGDTGTTVWMQSAPIALAAGWNHDVTFDLDSSEWGATQGATAPGASFIGGLFPPAMRAAGMVQKFYLCFVDARFGTVWVDNIRFGRSGGGLTTFAKADVSAQTELGPLELKASVQAGTESDANAWVQPGAAHAILRAGGQSLALSYGEAVPAFDDVLGVYTGKMGMSTGLVDYSHVPLDQVSALDWQGGIGVLHAQAFGALPWGPTPYSFDGDAFGGLRLKAVGADTWVGGTVVEQRLGYAGADIVDGTVQQDSQTLEIDGGRSFFGGNLGIDAGYGTTLWGQAPEYLLLRDSQGDPVEYSRPLSPTADAVNVKGLWLLGPLRLTALYASADTSFDNTLSDTLDDATQRDVKADLKFDQIQAVRNAFAAPGVLSGLGKGMDLSVEGKTYLSAEPSPYPYGASDVVVRFNNENDEALGYILYFDGKVEAKPVAAGDPLQTNDRLDDMRLILFANPWSGAHVQALARAQWTEEFPTVDVYDAVTNVTGTVTAAYSGFVTVMGVQASQVICGKHSVTFSFSDTSWPVESALAASQVQQIYAGYPAQIPSSYALQAGIHSQWTSGWSTDLSYGRAPFSQDIMNTSWINPDPETTLRLDGSF